MGFMSGGLGFASGMGSFITGAAAKENQILDEQRKQGREDDLIWQEKFQRGKNDYENEAARADNETKFYNGAIQAAGNRQIADQALNWYRSNPKAYPDIMNWVQAQGQAAKGGKADWLNPNYQSDTVGDINKRVNDRYQGLDAMRGQVSPNASRMMNMPHAPDQSPQFPNSDYGQPQGNPQGQPMGASSQPPQDQSSGQPSGQPSVQPVASQSAPGQPPQPMANAPDQMVPSPGQQPPNAAPQPIPAPGGTNPALTPNAAPSAPTGGWIPMGAAGKPSNSPVLNPRDPMTWDKYGSRQGLEQALIDSGVPADQAKRTASQAMTADQVLKNKQSEKDDNSIRDLNKDFAKTNAKDYLSELYLRKKSAQNVNEIYNDSDNLVRMFENGVHSSAAQPIVDGTNRLLSSVGFDVLQHYGIANSVNTANEAGKVLTRLMFGQIPNYHLGRWTDREFKALQAMLPDMGKDENTNLKIALLLRSGAARSRDSTREELSALGNDAYNPNVSAAMNTSNKYSMNTENLPWMVINSQKQTPEMVKAFQEAPNGAYWEENAPGANRGRLFRKNVQ